MPRQNTCPTHFPAFILQQIEQVAARVVATRKARGETQAQWAAKLGISQPTMARLERGDPAIATATYLTCLSLLNPQLQLLDLLDRPSTHLPEPPTAIPALTPTAQPAPGATPGAVEDFAALLSEWNMSALNT